MDKEQLRRLLELSSGMQVLYVEDDEALQRTTLPLLGEFFGRVEARRDGQAGLEAYSEENWDLVISDLRMPVMDGVEMVRQIKAKKPEQMVLITSAHDEAQYLLELINLGVGHFLTKPLDFEKLAEQIGQIAHSFQLRRLEEDYKAELEREVRQQTAQLRTAYERLERIDQTKQTMLALLGHETRTPLNGILGPLEILKEGDSSPDELAEMLGLIETNALALMSLAEKTNLLSGLLHQDLAETGPGRLDHAAQKALDSRQEAAQKAGVALEFKGQEVQLHAQWSLVDWVFKELLDNALAQSPQGAQVLVEVRAQEAGGLVEVGDQGPGIAEDWLEKVFEPFVVQSVLHHHKGHGLGLAIARCVAKLHQGKLSAHRAPSGGALLRLQLPKG